MTRAIVIAILSLTLFAWAQTEAGQDRRSAAGQPCHCAASEAEIADQHQEAAELARTIASLQARMTMLRNDAGSLSNQQVRDALQVEAEMWASVIQLLQNRADRLQQRGASTAPSH
jgi:hypothetical protein